MIVPDVSTLRKKGMECFCIRYNQCGTVKDGYKNNPIPVWCMDSHFISIRLLSKISTFLYRKTNMKSSYLVLRLQS